MIIPTKPEKLKENMQKSFPDFVIVAFNNLLEKKYRGGDIKILQEEAVKEILSESKKANQEITKDEIFRQKLLDIEDLYQEFGWKVRYDSPAYNETHFESYWIFSEKKI